MVVRSKKYVLINLGAFGCLRNSRVSWVSDYAKFGLVTISHLDKKVAILNT